MNDWQNKEILKTSSQNKKAAGVGVAAAQIHLTIVYTKVAPRNFYHSRGCNHHGKRPSTFIE